MAKTKKVLFVLVEGRTDKISLQKPLEVAYPNMRVCIKPFNGDITSDRYSNSNNIEDRIYESMIAELRKKSLNRNDVMEIIHIVDTDGAYIPNSNVVTDLSCKHPVYYPVTFEIHTQNKAGIENRNSHKRKMIDLLVEMTDIKGIPYRVFYMSCNLDHVLHGKPNATQEMKVKSAKRFALRYGNDLYSLINFLSNSVFSYVDEYGESWEFLRFHNNGINSISRLTNVGIVFKPVI